MSGSKLDPLLDELLSGEELARCRAGSLERMLESARRRRRRRRTRNLVAWTALPALLALTLSLRHASTPGPTRSASPALPATTLAAEAPRPEPASPGKAPVRFISDDELLGLFPGRPVALVGAPGRQLLVFLD